MGLSTFNRFRLARVHNVPSDVDLGDLVDRAKNELWVDYDVAVDGGLVSTIALNKTGKLSGLVAAKLPSKAIVKNVVIDIITPFVSAGGTGTIAVSSEGAADLLAAVDADTLANQVQGIPNDAVANMVKLTADRTVSVVVGTEALTAGKCRIFIEYLLSA